MTYKRKNQICGISERQIREEEARILSRRADRITVSNSTYSTPKKY